MFDATLGKMNEKAIAKIEFLEHNFKKYFLAAMVAGFYVGLAFFFVMIVASIIQQTIPGYFYKISMGLTFAIALNLIVFAGSELFTGNNMLMMTGFLDKKISATQVIKLWVFCYLGNFVGSIIVAILFVSSGALDGIAGEFTVAAADAKSSYTASSFFLRGIFCNIFVCLATLCCTVMKEESAKLVMIFWCIFAFVVAGFEHSIANMGLFSAALLLDTEGVLSIARLGTNLFWVTLGNILGGAGLGAVYYYLGKK